MKVFEYIIFKGGGCMDDYHYYYYKNLRKGEKIKMKNLEFIKKIAVDIISEEELMKKLSENRKLIIKLGADPSRPDLHLGHTVVLRALKHFQEMGHDVVFVIGDFTGMIGDPSGRNKTRPALTKEQTRESGKSYFKQVTKILDKNKTKIMYNSEWLTKMNFNDVIDIASKYTIAQLLERDDFKNRYQNNLPISVHELLYPLIQGYDSVQLKADIEIGGTDQTFNLLVGRELQKAYGQEKQVVITFPLLVGLDGKEKMSKSLDNYIGIDESPEIIYEKCMKIPDNCLLEYFVLTTDIEEEKAKKFMAEDIVEAHRIYAREIIKMYHGEEFVLDAENRYNAISNGLIPDNIDVINISKENPKINITDLLVSLNFVNSKSEAKRMISQRAVKINDNVITDINYVLDLKNEIILKYGKNKVLKII